jgi:hypothetical protein
MKITSKILVLVSLFALTAVGCKEDEAEFVMENAPYTITF